jgi:hypothetical protein
MYVVKGSEEVGNELKQYLKRWLVDDFYNKLFKWASINKQVWEEDLTEWK